MCSFNFYSFAELTFFASEDLGMHVLLHWLQSRNHLNGLTSVLSVDLVELLGQYIGLPNLLIINKREPLTIARLIIIVWQYCINVVSRSCSGSFFTDSRPFKKHVFSWPDKSLHSLFIYEHASSHTTCATYGTFSLTLPSWVLHSLCNHFVKT